MARSKILSGGCHCGKVRYRIDTAAPEGYYCHCRMCQLSFGNIFATFINVKKSEVVWQNEPPAFFASSAFAKRGFCNTCGTPLSFEYLDSKNMDISVGSLDAPAKIVPTSNFAFENRVQGWTYHSGLEEVRFDEHLELQERWKKNYGSLPPGIETVRSSEKR